VTPSYNQGSTILRRSTLVLEQEYPSLEYVVLDSGSSDSTVYHIHERDDKLTYWCTEPENGMYDALNRGFAQTTGEVMAWINQTISTSRGLWRLAPKSSTHFPRSSGSLRFQPMDLEPQADRLGACAPAASTAEPSRAGNRFRSTGMRRTRSLRIVRSRVGVCGTRWERRPAELQCAADLELWARLLRHANIYDITVLLAADRRGDVNQKAIKLAGLCTWRNGRWIIRTGYTGICDSYAAVSRVRSSYEWSCPTHTKPGVRGDQRVGRQRIDADSLEDVVAALPN
jgi:glycosyltransferase involved in cell wall biosynthesis